MAFSLRALATLGLAIAITALVACSSESMGGEPGASSGAGGGPGGSSGAANPTSDAGTTADGGGGTEGAAGPSNNGFPAKWIDGTACATEAKVQVWKYDETTIILRQSLCTNYEGPFVYLLLGRDKGLLVDTGTGAVDVYGEVQKLIGGRDLIVAHSHSHGDHVGGDGQFTGKAKTTVVGTQVAAVRAHFGVPGDASAAYDLGDRVLDVLAIPGHQAAHLAFYDRRTRLLLTGDTLYPGRLYIDDFASYKTSIARLAAFVDGGHPVSWILGGHIELAAAGNGADFAIGTKAHPSEHVLELTTAELKDLQSVVGPMGVAKRTVRPHYTLSP